MVWSCTIFFAGLCLVSICAAICVDDEDFAEILDRLHNVETKLSKQNDEIKDLRAILADERKTKEYIQSYKQARQLLNVTEGPVAFSAAIKPKVVEHMHANVPFKFDKILLNLGYGYDSATGIFTAPLPGIYILSCSVLDHMGDDGHGTTMLHAEIVKNGVVLARVFAHANNEYRDQGAQTIIANVNRGDRIWIRAIDNNNLGLGGEMYTTFSGYMLWQTG